MTDFLPINADDLKQRKWDGVDFAYIIGDAYVDHSSFGHAVISRVLEHAGYRVGIIAQPDWKDPKSINVFGKPRLGFLVMSGNMDSMVNHFAVSKNRRDADAFTPGGALGKRPDRALTVYCNLIRHTYKDVPILIGGIEASLRRFSHYDYWSDSVRRSVLLDCAADLLIYGMGEKAIVEAANALRDGGNLKNIRGTVYMTRDMTGMRGHITLPSFDKVRSDKTAFARSFALQYQNTDPFSAKPLVEAYGDGTYVVQNPPQFPLTTPELDAVYELPYMRNYHPMYEAAGGVPALTEVKFSLTVNRGCFGGCSFCALTFHQGRIVQNRSIESVVKEAKLMIADPEFKGYIHDVGGPTANFFRPSCDKQTKNGACKDRQCMFPQPCPNLKPDHSGYLKMLEALSALPGVKKVFVRSGIRYDYLMADPNPAFFNALVKNHVSGQLRVAPEHVCDTVLQRMGKPPAKVYEKFCNEFEKRTEKEGKKQYVVPYLMSSHPGSGLKEAIALAEYLRDHKLNPMQVQDFYPTPSTVSTCMYYTGIDPRDMSPVYVPTDPYDKAMQRALIQYRETKNQQLVKAALEKAGRKDLIGLGKNCLIK